MGIIQTAINRPVTVTMFVLAVILFGAVSVQRLSLNLLPEISYPSLTVQTDYEDAAPEEVESLVTRPVEEAVGVVPGLTRMGSISRSGQSDVVLEFGWDTDMDLATLEVREKLDFVVLPRDVRKPVILRFDPSHDPIMRIRLYGSDSLSRLRYQAEEQVKKPLESTEGVAAIKVVGGLEEQIQIEVDEKRLATLGIPIREVTQILGEENLNQSTGSLYDLDASYMVRMLNQFQTVDEIGQIVIRSEAGKSVALEDVARVWRGTKDREIIARLNGRESVELAIYKEGDANTVTVANAVVQALVELEERERFPKNLDYQIVSNQARFIEQSVNNVLTSAILGGLLATLVLFVFLRDVRSTVVIAFCIPISIMATFALMYQTGVTLNIMSLGGVALGVGMLVDNSIVVLESVHRRRKNNRLSTQAVHGGTREVGKAVVASTLTTIAVFLPLVFVEGIAGQLFRDQALTITYALGASLFVALTFIPMVLAWRRKTTGEALASQPENTSLPKKPYFFLKPIVTDAIRAFRFAFVWVPKIVLTDLVGLLRVLSKPFLHLIESGFATLNRQYPALQVWALDNKGRVLVGALLMVLLSGWMATQLGAELIPPLTQGEFTFEIRLPEGRPLRQTDKTLASIEREVARYPEVAFVFSSIGGKSENQFSLDANKENEAQLHVVLKGTRLGTVETIQRFFLDREPSVDEDMVVSRIREHLDQYPDLGYEFSRPTLFSFKTPIEVELFGYNLDSLRRASEMVEDQLSRIPGLYDIETSTQEGNPELHVRFDRDRLARLGLEENKITESLRNKIRGDVATRFAEEDKRIEILVRASEEDRTTLESLRNLVVNASLHSIPGDESVRESSNGVEAQQPRGPALPVRLGAVADVSLQRGPGEIRRIQAQRAALVSANLSGRDLNSVSEDIQGILNGLRAELPKGVTVLLAGQNEELRTSYRSLIFALTLAVFLVYLVMASQFESLIHPLIIMGTVPLGLIGVVFALFFTRTTISVVVLLGVIILAGIVVNNAIVLIDYTNQLRQGGSSRRKALMEAGKVRLRPITMTTLTTVLGLFPMALSWGEGSELRAPMAIAVMGGLIFSTVLTLIIVPVIYELMDRKVYLSDTGTIQTTANSMKDSRTFEEASQ